MKKVFLQFNRLLTRGILAFTLSLIFSISVFSTTLTEYKKSVNTAITELNYIRFPDEEITYSEKLTEEKDVLKIVRDDLLKITTIEGDGFAVDGENKWLRDKLVDFEKLPATDDKRFLVLDECLDRLTALQQKIDEAEKQPVGTRTKDADKQKLDEILNRGEFQKAEIPKEKTGLAKWWDDIREAIAKFFEGAMPKTPVATPDSAGLQGFATVLQILVVGLAIAIIGFLIYRFLPYFTKFRREKKKERKTRVILGETILANQDATDVFAEAELLAKSGDTRGAIRKGYIAVLCGLSDKKIIGLEQHKTNRDYLFDVRKRESLLQTMRKLTGSFEKHWYGLDSASESDWQEFREDYRSVAKEN
jgi:Domain of unknown function (DUF4129)